MNDTPEWLLRLIEVWGEPHVRPPTGEPTTARVLEHEGYLWYHLGRGRDTFLRRAWVWFPENQNTGLHIDFRGSRPGEGNRYRVEIWGVPGGVYVRSIWENVPLDAFDTVVAAAMPIVFGVTKESE